MNFTSKKMLALVITVSAVVGFMMASSTPYDYSAYADFYSERVSRQENYCNSYSSSGTGGPAGGAAAVGHGTPAVDGGVGGDAGDINNYTICINK
jgi:uncharacterized protein involved in exopolysaccharide biosynthesis